MPLVFSDRTPSSNIHSPDKGRELLSRIHGESGSPSLEEILRHLIELGSKVTDPDNLPLLLAAREAHPHSAAIAVSLLQNLSASRSHAQALPLALELGGKEKLELDEAFWIGRTLLEAGDFRSAVSFLTRAVSEFPAESQLHHLLGLAHRSLGNLPQALASFRKGVECAPYSDAALIQTGSVLRQMGRLDEAIEFFGAAIRINPEARSTLLMLGNALAEKGELEGAMQCYSRSIESEPDATKHPDIIQNLAATLIAAGRAAEAIPLLEKLHKLRPPAPASIALLATALRDTGRREESRFLAQQLLAKFPGNAVYQQLLTNCESTAPPPAAASSLPGSSFPAVREPHSKAGDSTPLPEAPEGLETAILRAVQRGASVELLENAFRVLSAHPEPFAAMKEAEQALYSHPSQTGWRLEAVCAVLRHLAGNSAPAKEWGKHALQLESTAADDWTWLGKCLLRAGLEDEAVCAFERACAQEDVTAKAPTLLAKLRVDRKEFPEAERAMRQAIGLSPSGPSEMQMYLSLGWVLYMRGNFAEAARVTEAASRGSRDPAVLATLAGYYMKSNCFAEAIHVLERAISADPNSAFAYTSLMSCLLRLGMAQEGARASAKAASLDPQSTLVASNYLQLLNYLPQASGKDIYEAHVDFSNRFETPLLQTHRPHSNSRNPRRRLKIGYLSSDLRDHSVAYFIEPILRHHNREDFEVWGIVSRQWRDKVTERLQSYCDGWLDATHLDDAELAERLRSEGFDILVDLACHTEGGRLLTLARKPAPVQLTMIGMQQTTGLRSIDYRVTDSYMDPDERSELIHSEKLIRLSCGFVFEPPRDAPPIAPLPALQNGCITFGSFNNIGKAHEGVVQSWSRILQALPNSRMVVCAPAGSPFPAMLAKTGVDPERVRIFPHLKGSDYLKMHEQVDLALDTFPFAGLTVSSIAAWMGVPTVTIAGTTAVSRAGARIQHALGLDQLIATDPRDFEKRAVEAASQIPLLAEVRQSMRERTLRVLGDGARFTREYESALRRAWENWCSS